MLRRLSIPFAIAGLATLTPSAAEACSYVRIRPPTLAENMREARDTIARATAIVDGEVIRPSGPGTTALVRAHRVLKGPPQAIFEIGERDSCDNAPRTMGDRLRMVLVGGPDVYFLSLRQGDPRAEDRILRSDRRRDWPYRSGPAIPVETLSSGQHGPTRRLVAALDAALRASPRFVVSPGPATDALKLTIRIADRRRVLGRIRINYSLTMERGGRGLPASTGGCWESELDRCAARVVAAATAAVR
jgi:hypothetical protein